MRHLPKEATLKILLNSKSSEICLGTRRMTLQNISYFVRALELDEAPAQLLDLMVRRERLTEQETHSLKINQRIETLQRQIHDELMAPSARHEGALLAEHPEWERLYHCLDSVQWRNTAAVASLAHLPESVCRRELEKMLAKKLILFNKEHSAYRSPNPFVHTRIQGSAPSQERFEAMLNTFQKFQDCFSQSYRSPESDPNVRPYVFRGSGRIALRDFISFKQSLERLFDQYLRTLRTDEADPQKTIFIDVVGGLMRSEEP